MEQTAVRLLLTLFVAWAAPGLAAADGAALYDKTCASCHGKEGKNGTAMPIAGRSASVVTAMIKSHTPPMKFKLTDQEIQAIVKYVAGLKL